jgi:hypothetical protein
LKVTNPPTWGALPHAGPFSSWGSPMGAVDLLAGLLFVVVFVVVWGSLTRGRP